MYLEMTKIQAHPSVMFHHTMRIMVQSTPQVFRLGYEAHCKNTVDLPIWAGLVRMPDCSQTSSTLENFSKLLQLSFLTHNSRFPGQKKTCLYLLFSFRNMSRKEERSSLTSPAITRTSCVIRRRMWNLLYIFTFLCTDQLRYFCISGEIDV